jgi:pimeloyl-ACP methyl ester carboxylesterase
MEARMPDDASFIEHYLPMRDGLQLYCRDYGSAAGAAARNVVLCLPGLTRNCRDFESLATALSANYRVLTPDFRGRGRSQWDSQVGNYQPMQYAADMLAILDALQVERVVVIGTSLGGLVAMVIAMLRPGILAGVVLNDVGPEIDSRGAARIASYVGNLPPVTSWEEAALQARSVNGAALPDFTAADWLRFARAAYRDDGAGRPVLDMDPRIGEALRTATGPTPDLWPLFAALRAVPTLVIRGALSDILSEATVEKMRANKPDLRILVVDDRGHAPTLDEPAARAALREFLADRMHRS